MEKTEVADLLSALAAENSFQEVTPTRIMLWWGSLRDYPADLVLEAVIEARETQKFVDVSDIMTVLTARARKQASLVRAAVLRGLVPDTWPAERALPERVVARLRAEVEATNDSPEDVHAVSAKPIASPEQIQRALGVRLKSPDDV